MTSSLPGILTACVSRAEVVLSDKKGAALATIFRNFDGACGRELIEAARLEGQLGDTLLADTLARSMPKMAGLDRTTALTTGSGTSSDVYDLMAHEADVSEPKVMQVVCEAVRRLGVEQVIFEQDEADVLCTVRAHFFP